MSDKVRPSRRQALLGDRAGSYAIARQVRIAPQKVRRVVDMVRGMDAITAVDTLEFAPQAAAEPVRKCIYSAMANAEQTDALRADELFVSHIFVDEGTTMRRIRPRAKGSASRILKRSSHITVVVEPFSNKELTGTKVTKAAVEVAEEPEVEAKPAKKSTEKKADAKKADAKKAGAKKADAKPAKDSKKKAAAKEEKGA